MNKLQSDALFQATNQRIWDQLDHLDWPDELATIKPRKWDALDAKQKGKAVLENLGQIIYHVTLLTNGQSFSEPGKHSRQESLRFENHPNLIYP